MIERGVRYCTLSSHTNTAINHTSSNSKQFLAFGEKPRYTTAPFHRTANLRASQSKSPPRSPSRPNPLTSNPQSPTNVPTPPPPPHHPGGRGSPPHTGHPSSLRSRTTRLFTAVLRFSGRPECDASCGYLCCYGGAGEFAGAACGTVCCGGCAVG